MGLLPPSTGAPLHVRQPLRVWEHVSQPCTLQRCTPSHGLSWNTRRNQLTAARLLAQCSNKATQLPANCQEQTGVDCQGQTAVDLKPQTRSRAAAKGRRRSDETPGERATSTTRPLHGSDPAGVLITQTPGGSLRLDDSSARPAGDVVRRKGPSESGEHLGDTGGGYPWRVYEGVFPDLDMESILGQLDLQREVITTASGLQVEEARSTGWQSDVGLPFIYSGKRMIGGPLNPMLISIRDRLQTLVGSYYDSVLINYYPDGKSGMRFHSDPLYGVWDPDTAVVSLGNPRMMVFRDRLEDLGPPVKGVKRVEPRHYKYVVHHGTVVHMFGDCQDRFQHSIRTERTAEDAGPRASLVFKREVRV